MTNFDELSPYFEQLAAADKFAGVVLITQGEQQLYAGAYGYASRAWQVKNTLAMRFDTASITKLFTAVAILQLIDQQLLTLDTRVIDYLRLAGTTIAPAVTVFQLLTHTSGIADDADEEAGESYEAVWRTKPNYSVLETSDFLPQFAYKPPNFAPGVGCRYCNCSYVLLGLLIEKATGLTYRDYVQQQIFTPTGMNDSAFLRKDRVQANVAEGCDAIEDAPGQISGWKTNIYSFPPIGSPDGGAYVTAADLDRFLRTVQRGGLLSPALTAAFFTPQVHYRDRDAWTMYWGLGLWFQVDRADRVLFYQKEGINAGVSGVIRHYPAQNINVVLLSNMMEGVWEPLRQLHGLMVEQATEK